MSENAENEKKFVYAKVYVQEKLQDGTTPKLDTPVFRNSYKADEVTFEKPKINGMLADVSFQENYNKDGHDVNLLMVCLEEYVKLTFPCDRVLGVQLLKRLKGIDLTKKVVLEVWKNNKGYANLAVYQRDTDNVDEKGIPKKVFIKSTFEDDEVPMVETVKVGKKEVRDSSERTEFLMKEINGWIEGNKQLTENLKLVTYAPAEDDGNDDV